MNEDPWVVFRMFQCRKDHKYGKEEWASQQPNELKNGEALIRGRSLPDKRVFGRVGLKPFGQLNKAGPELFTSSLVLKIYITFSSPT